MVCEENGFSKGEEIKPACEEKGFPKGEEAGVRVTQGGGPSARKPGTTRETPQCVGLCPF